MTEAENRTGKERIAAGMGCPQKDRELEAMERYWFWLCSIPELSQKVLKALVFYFGSPRGVWEAPEEEFGIWKKTGAKWVEELLRFRRSCGPEQIWHSAEKKGIKFISREREGFPSRLRHIPDCPAGLFYRGRLPGEEAFSAAIVGARQCSPYGRIMARELSRALAGAGVQVISGLALGIDGTAQRAAAEAGGSSFGVLGCGVDQCYPQENFPLYQELLERGGVLSEFPPGSRPLPFHFPLRNRIISGLADAVIVVEAREKSGSLITADLALEQGKDVYAVPGRSTDDLSRGCNRLIAQGAGVILTPERLMEELKLEQTTWEKFRKRQLSLAPEEELVYSNLDLLPKGLNEIAKKTALPFGRLTEILLKLQLKGLAAEIAKNQYIKSER
ncbi:MAG: DNA-processing protein DprA [Lachnospiraceae bacterium]|nr:DNA-processing protein DprA [Lachnospiraceae bacterium]